MSPALTCFVVKCWSSLTSLAATYMMRDRSRCQQLHKTYPSCNSHTRSNQTDNIHLKSLDQFATTHSSILFHRIKKKQLKLCFIRRCVNNFSMHRFTYLWIQFLRQLTIHRIVFVAVPATSPAVFPSASSKKGMSVLWVNVYGNTVWYVKVYGTQWLNAQHKTTGNNEETVPIRSYVGPRGTMKRRSQLGPMWVHGEQWADGPN